MSEHLHFESSISKMEKEIFQMENCVCTIQTENNKIRIGFLCKIPFPNKNKSSLPVLITNNQVLNEKVINNNKNYINITINNIQKKLKIDNSRKKYMNHDKNVNITIIEISNRHNE